MRVNFSKHVNDLASKVARKLRRDFTFSADTFRLPWYPEKITLIGTTIIRDADFNTFEEELTKLALEKQHLFLTQDIYRDAQSEKNYIKAFFQSNDTGYFFGIDDPFARAFQLIIECYFRSYLHHHQIPAFTSERETLDLLIFFTRNLFENRFLRSQWDKLSKRRPAECFLLLDSINSYMRNFTYPPNNPQDIIKFNDFENCLFFSDFELWQIVLFHLFNQIKEEAFTKGIPRKIMKYVSPSQIEIKLAWELNSLRSEISHNWLTFFLAKNIFEILKQYSETKLEAIISVRPEKFDNLIEILSSYT